jgi:hypothetical protein
MAAVGGDALPIRLSACPARQAARPFCAGSDDSSGGDGGSQPSRFGDRMDLSAILSISFNEGYYEKQKKKILTPTRQDDIAFDSWYRMYGS